MVSLAAFTMTETEQRPWGWFEKFHENKPCTVKLIHINPFSRLSLQYHKDRSEFWTVVEGSAEVELDGRQITLGIGDSLTIPKGALHRVGAKQYGCVLLEIAYGKFRENDIVRLQDDYQRTLAQQQAA
jgi:mannose-6-phosphate isomerase-like protein (cupin superfamily)